MDTVELKKILISKISETDDNAFLEALHTILDRKSSNIEKTKTDYKQSNLDLLKAEEEDIENGRLYSNNQINEKVALWKNRAFGPKLLKNSYKTSIFTFWKNQKAFQLLTK